METNRSQKNNGLIQDVSLPSVNNQLQYPFDYVTQQVLIDFIRSVPLIPQRYSTTERDLLAPTKAMIIFNTTTNKLNFYNGSAWEAVTST